MRIMACVYYTVLANYNLNNAILYTLIQRHMFFNGLESVFVNFKKFSIKKITLFKNVVCKIWVTSLSSETNNTLNIYICRVYSNSTVLHSHVRQDSKDEFLFSICFLFWLSFFLIFMALL